MPHAVIETCPTQRSEQYHQRKHNITTIIAAAAYIWKNFQVSSDTNIYLRWQFRIFLLGVGAPQLWVHQFLRLPLHRDRVFFLPWHRPFLLAIQPVHPHRPVQWGRYVRRRRRGETVNILIAKIVTKRKAAVAHTMGTVKIKRRKIAQKSHPYLQPYPHAQYLRSEMGNRIRKTPNLQLDILLISVEHRLFALPQFRSIYQKRAYKQLCMSQNIMYWAIFHRAMSCIQRLPQILQFQSPVIAHRFSNYKKSITSDCMY